MSLNEARCMELLGKYPKLKSLVVANEEFTEPNSIYQQLESMRGTIEDEVYAYSLRKLLKMCTKGASKDLRLRMLEGVKRCDLMTQEELDYFEQLPSPITIYRGAKPEETEPGLSWSLKKWVAEKSEFYRGRLFKAEISKEQVLAYIGDQNEYEILADVKQFQIISEDKDAGFTLEERIEREMQEIFGNEA